MAMARPRLENTISTGQILTAVLLTVILGGGAWIATKDRNDVDLAAKLDANAKTAAEQNAGLAAQIAKMDGKLEAYGASFNTLSGRVDLLDQRLQAQEATAKEGRQERQVFQAEAEKRLGDLEGQVRVLNAMRGQK